jgi:hypothetical protein
MKHPHEHGAKPRQHVLIPADDALVPRHSAERTARSARSAAATLQRLRDCRAPVRGLVPAGNVLVPAAATTVRAGTRRAVRYGVNRPVTAQEHLRQ